MYIKIFQAKYYANDIIYLFFPVKYKETSYKKPSVVKTAYT